MSHADITTEIAQSLQREALTIATAESCTVGGVCARLGSIAGASTYLRGGIVAYQTPLKVVLLGLAAQLIEQQGVVSEAVALGMARGARECLHADIGVGTTGVAGPAGGSPECPVGTIWIAVSRAHPEGERIRTKKLHLDGDRAHNISEAIDEALQLVRELT